VPTTLDRLAAAAPGARITGDGATIVRELAYDSRHVRDGDLFFCRPGGTADGHDFAPPAVEAGATALVVERILDVPVPQLVVPSVARAMGPMAAAFFGHPSEAMTVVGVTGTNGKTTTTFMIESVVDALGMRPGLIGTVETHVADEVRGGVRTTPESIDLQRLMAQMRDAGVGILAMEVSSHGLDLHRVDGTRFACALFTNLSQDHLDFHGSMEEYFEAKAMLFDPALSDRAVVNVDDPAGRRLIERTRLPVATSSLERDADVRATRIAMDASGSDVAAVVGGREVSVRVPLPARYNVANALGVLGVALSMGWPLDEVIVGIEALRGVPGRLEPIDEGQGFAVLVDYAHTPEALEGVLDAVRGFTPPGARLIAVFGAGGDRDRTKRRLMGLAVGARADHAIITSDNPRTEDPLAIIAAIEAGMREADSTYESIPDRREAIDAAIGGARDGDVIVIAGKGHEPGQEFADRTVQFDDRQVARESLARRLR